jgi:hypothetical protein
VAFRAPDDRQQFFVGAEPLKGAVNLDGNLRLDIRGHVLPLT